MASITERELQGIHKELRELNKRLDRLCRASIFSVKDPTVNVVSTKRIFTDETEDDDYNLAK